MATISADTMASSSQGFSPGLQLKFKSDEHGGYGEEYGDDDGMGGQHDGHQGY
jgi:hypothetical protein